MEEGWDTLQTTEGIAALQLCPHVRFYCYGFCLGVSLSSVTWKDTEVDSF